MIFSKNELVLLTVQLKKLKDLFEEEAALDKEDMSVMRATACRLGVLGDKTRVRRPSSDRAYEGLSACNSKFGRWYWPLSVE
jgi:hypothetical protein